MQDCNHFSLPALARQALFPRNRCFGNNYGGHRPETIIASLLILGPDGAQTVTTEEVVPMQLHWARVANAARAKTTYMRRPEDQWKRRTDELLSVEY
jgi:hypothetical protein